MPLAILASRQSMTVRKETIKTAVFTAFPSTSCWTLSEHHIFYASFLKGFFPPPKGHSLSMKTCTKSFAHDFLLLHNEGINTYNHP